MPRGVYKRKQSKAPPTIGDLKLSDLLPQETLNRITVYCRGNNMMVDAFIKKAIYDVLPVQYTVDETFVFPFGKYQGESAQSVVDMDPDYLTWCQKNIVGFTVCFEVEKVATEEVEESANQSKPSSVETWELRDALRPHVAFGENLKINRLTAWAHNPSTDRWRKLATRNTHDTWTLCV